METLILTKEAAWAAKNSTIAYLSMLAEQLAYEAMAERKGSIRDFIRDCAETARVRIGWASESSFQADRRAYTRQACKEIREGERELLNKPRNRGF